MPPEIIDSWTGEYDWLSHFAWATVVLKIERQGQVWEDTYNSVEKAYQAAKAKDYAFFRTKYMATELPSWKAKRMGRQIESIPMEQWAREKEPIMLSLERSKFSREPLRSKLIETFPAVLIEGNLHHDNFWGDCRCLQVPFPAGAKYGQKQKCKEPGLNRAGQLIMQVRDEIMKEMRIGRTT